LGRLWLFDLSARRVVAEFRNPSGGISILGFSPDGSLLAAAGNGIVTLWETATRREVRRVVGHSGSVNALAFHPDGKTLATGGADRTVRLWNLTTGQPGIVFRGHAGAVRSLAFGHGGDWLASGSEDGTVRVWDPARDPRGRRLAFPWSNDVAFDPAPASPAVRAVNSNGGLQAWAVADGRVLTRAPVRGRLATSHGYRHTAYVGGRRVAVVTADDPHLVVLLDADTGRPLGTLPPAGGPVLAIAADSTGRRLAWAAAGDRHGGTPGSATEVCCWDLATQTAIGSARLDATAVRALAVESGGRWIAAVTAPGTSAADGTAWVIDPTGHEPPREIVRGPRMLGGAAYSPNGRELAIAVGDAVHIYRADMRELLHQVPCPPPTTCLAYSPDGRRLAAVNSDGVVTIADPVAGKALFQLRGLAQPRPNDVAGDARVAFRPDGRWLVSTSWDGSPNLWDGSPAERQ
jgi:WD40 repeat protein